MLLAVLHAMLLAATMVPQSIEQLTDRATLVVRATVGGRKSRFAAGNAGIYTYTELRVEETLKGVAPPALVVRQAGGAIGNQKVTLPGNATLNPGEEVLVFLRCRANSSPCSVVGLAQGKFHLASRAGGATIATRDFREVEFVQGAALSEGPDAYADLSRRIRQHAEASK